MQTEEIYFNPEFSLLPGQKDILKNIIEWKDPPPIVKNGRSTFLVIDNKELPFVGIKIKGCGYFNILKNEAFPPSDKKDFDLYVVDGSDGIKEIHYVTKVNDRNELDFIIPDKRPFGGQTFLRAKLEFDANNELYKNWKDIDENFPFYFPIGYAKYKDFNFKNEKLGVTILGSKNAAEVPLSSFFDGTFEDKGLKINPHILNYWRNHCSALGKKDPDYFDLLNTLKKLCFEFGRSLKFLNEYYVDFDSHFFNATVNMESGKVILFDFDHVSPIKNMHPQKYFYFSMKDFEAGFVAILSNFLLSGLSQGVVLFDQLSQPTDEYNPVLAYFEGYFGTLPDSVIQDAKNIWDRMLMLIMNKILNADQNKIIHMVYDFCEFERKKSFIDLFNAMKEKTNIKFPDFKLESNTHKTIVENFYLKLDDFLNSHKK